MERETADPGWWPEATSAGDRAVSPGGTARRTARAASPGETAPGEENGDPEARARQICLRLLTLAPRTRAQLAEALRKKDIPDDAAAAVLSRFEDVGLIDDAAFARAWVESRHHSRGLAGRALSAELKQRGVAADEIRVAIDEGLSPEDELAAARRLVAAKLPGTRGQPAPQRMRRLAGQLARKGYPAGLAFRVIREALEGEEDAAVLDDEPPFDESDL
jgi:regulatory protein